ncbi:hypothetical protein LCGC14_2244770, partial [marine sediment metagenome]
LNQLAELPQQTMVPKVIEYLQSEKDPDLIVHAIRFLRVAGSPEAVKSLMSLLEHESWQVRAEAAEAIGKSSDSLSQLPGSFGDGEPSALMADAYVALIDLLDDPDAFVVSRAVEGLSQADMALAVEPLVEAARKHPQLASSIVGLLAEGRTMRLKALPHLRKFTAHEDPTIRTAAIEGLFSTVPHAMEEELAAGLGGVDGKVRMAAASVVFAVLETQRSAAESRFERGNSTELQGIELDDPFGGPFIEPTRPSLIRRICSTSPQKRL